MSVAGSRAVGDPAAVLRRLHGVMAWPAFGPVDRVDLASDDGDVADVTVWFEGPRPLRARLEVRREADGVVWTLLEGDASELSGEIRVSEGTVRWQATVGVPVTVPWALWNELDAALARALGD